jgi:hypothetical protein
LDALTNAYLRNGIPINKDPGGRDYSDFFISTVLNPFVFVVAAICFFLSDRGFYLCLMEKVEFYFEQYM